MYPQPEAHTQKKKRNGIDRLGAEEERKGKGEHLTERESMWCVRERAAAVHVSGGKGEMLRLLSQML